MGNFIETVLPHRDPFLFVDEILEYSYRNFAIGLKKVQDNEFWAKGHFPTNPVFPGVLLLETMAQVGGFVFVNEDTNTIGEGSFTYLSKVDGLKLKSKIVPGDIIRVEAKFESAFSRYASVYTIAKVNNKTVGEAKITYTFLEEL